LALNLTDFWSEASSYFIKMAPQQEVVLTDAMKAAIVIWIKFLNNCDDEVPEVMAADAVATVLVKNGARFQDGIRVVGGGHQWPYRIRGIANGPQVDAEVERVSCQGKGNC
jgi:hypothetical protein